MGPRAQRRGSQDAIAARIGQHVRRWRRRVRSALGGRELVAIKPSPYVAADRLSQAPAVPRPKA
jgi:hypothetical protein